MADVADDYALLAEMALPLFESSPDGILLVDDAGKIRLLNQQAQLLFGYSRSELRGRAVETLIPEDARQRHEGHRSGFFSEPRSRPMGIGLKLAGRRKDGSEFPAEINLSPVVANRGVFVIATVRRARPAAA